MTLSVGIVGLPNVGKSTLFNAITLSSVEASNYPFCTIDPHSGIVAIMDDRVATLSKKSASKKTTYATIEFVDIAGLVKGASKGEGLGNQFLGNIRNTSVIAHVVRCFDDDDIVHVDGTIDPIADIETINTELLLADFDMVVRLIESQKKRLKTNDKQELVKMEFLKKIEAHLANSKPVRTLTLSNEEEYYLSEFSFLTAKKVIYVANVSENDCVSENDYVQQVRSYAKSTHDSVIVICAQLESELNQLEDDEKKEFLASYGLKKSGLEQLSQSAFDLLGLQTYLTTGEKETRAWVIKKGARAPQAAGVIHTDFEKGFIRANVISYPDFLSCDGWKKAKEQGLIRQEGKEYIMKHDDIVEFLFNI